MSTGPRTLEGRARIGRAAKAKWERYRQQKPPVLSATERQNLDRPQAYARHGVSQFPDPSFRPNPNVTPTPKIDLSPISLAEALQRIADPTITLRSDGDITGTKPDGKATVRPEPKQPPIDRREAYEQQREAIEKHAYDLLSRVRGSGSSSRYAREQRPTSYASFARGRRR